jgi:3-isopropylmalate/(R)-2-methylmalate dehydratase large subunit
LAGKTLFEKIWDKHVVTKVESGPSVLYIDRHFVHEVTSPQAFGGLKERAIKVRRPEKTIATADHNIPTLNQNLPIQDDLSRVQVNKLTQNCKDFGVELYGLNHSWNGIVHVIGPELGITKPGMTIVCGDSHTSTHGAFGNIAFGIGTSEVEMTLATQTLLQNKPMTMRINIDGELDKGVVSKDIVLYIISKIGTGGATGYFVEFAGSAIRSLSMEARMTICNMSIEMGARGGMIAPDKTTFEYIKDRKFAPKGAEWDKAMEEWRKLPTDPDAKFDKELTYNTSDIEPMITYGTNPGMGMGISQNIQKVEDLEKSSQGSFKKSMEYMGFQPGDPILNKKVDYVFMGSCTNGRIEDLRAFTQFVKGRKKAEHVIAWIVPGSHQVEEQAEKEGLREILEEAGFEMRQPGCSACLAMNDDKIPEGQYAVSTSNRNFEGRQGPGARTMLASPLTAAAAAITGKVTDPRDFL